MKLNFNFYSRDLANKFRAGVGSRFVLSKGVVLPLHYCFSILFNFKIEDIFRV